MNNKTRLLLLAAFIVLALPLMFSGIASAMYMEDGARPTGTGGWQIPTDMVCIVGLHADGTLDIADGVTNSRDCIYLNKGTMNGGTPFDLTGMTTSAACTVAGGAGNDGAKHAWATSGCWDGSGNPVSLKGLDRTTQMCTAKGGTWITTGKCVAYNRQFKGQDASGTPLAFGSKGTTQGAGTGYCYASMNMTTAYSTSAACPSVNAAQAPFNANAAYDWAFSSSKCSYAKGIKGYPLNALAKADGTTVPVTTNIDLSTFTTMGECLATGGSWNNWTGQAASTTSVATTPSASTVPAWDYTRQAPDADNACIHCHSTTVEYNGPAEREKDSYVKTGHKNMLRKVTAGQQWAGPDGVVYTTDGTNAIDFMTSSDPYAKITVGSTAQNLYYIYGDWMAALPSVVYGTNGYGSAPGATNGYTCYACHATGASDNTAAVPGVQSIGTTNAPKYAGVQPGETFPGINLGATNPKWDLEGIQCGRCHNAEVGPINAAMISASTFSTTHITSGGMGSLANGTGRTNLCFGCHQSIAKNWPAQGGAAGGTTQYDPTLIPTGVSHGAAVGRDFNGHVLGNSFLNSVHGQYAGVNNNALAGGIKLNALGKYDLVDTEGTAEYRGTFQGYTCWQSSSSSSPAKTKDATGAEIKDKTTCESLYGSGAWRTDTKGTCSTCHDVHNSLFVEDQAEAAMRKSCDDCHVNNATTGATVGTAPQITDFNHPTSMNTPFDTAKYESSCVVCHMATQAEENGNQNSMPVHLWRINTSASYNTFPTADQWDGLNGAIKDRNAQTAPDGVQTNAVWVDLDLACGQCHGGSVGASLPGIQYFSKSSLAALAKDMHVAAPIITNTPPVPANTVTPSGWNAVVVDSSTDAQDAPGTMSVSVSCGNGTTQTGHDGDTLTCVYTTAGTYTVRETVTDTGGMSANAAPVSVYVPVKYHVSGTATKSNGTTPISGALLYLKVGTQAKYSTSTAANGTFTFNNVAPGTYNLTATKAGYTFANPALVVTVTSSDATGQNFSSTTP